MRRVWKARTKLAEDLPTQLLRSRGLLDEESIEDFLNPRYEKSHSPLLLTGMDRAVARVQQAVARDEQITVYADYDADAVTAAAVLLRYFQKIGYPKANYYIPDRNSEGYGVSTDAVKRLAEQGTKLIITVDCGINAFDAIDLATFLGIDVVVTDHHQLTAGIPRAAAVVNPHQPGDQYPFKDLTGVGVAFKLVQALIKSVIARNEVTKQSQGSEIATRPMGARNDNSISGFEKWLLDFVAIGTVADCQSLLGENRIFVKWGLQVLAKTRWRGLKQLTKLAGIFGQKLDAYHLGFIIAPRLNAAGRIEHANSALELLLTDDDAEAELLAEKLSELNHHRQQLTETVLSEAREQLTAVSDKKILLASGSNWPKGIVGLVAGKLTEEFYRPVLILERGEEEATGSARSIAGFNIVEAIGQSRDILLRYGGHAQAAGFTLRTSEIDAFHKNLLKYAENILTEEALLPVLFYDWQSNLGDFTSDFLDFLEKFTPFGIGNPRPRVRVNEITPRFPSAIGNEGKHLRFYAGDFACIGFNLGYWADKLKQEEKIDIVCEPQYNEWNGERKIQLKIIDLDHSK